MRMEDLRYYTIVTLLVLGSAGLNTMIVVWVVEMFFTLSDSVLYVTVVVTYIVICLVGMIHAIPRLRGFF